ncbi:hypothetical protein FRC07_012530 [Ceratobasidium sp. 392]|nr:hypothetical protein FRC07_012530 [Ceratobasidium sp. 392]
MNVTIKTRDSSSISPRRELPATEIDSAPRKKSRKSTIMEALRRGASLAQEQAAGAEDTRQMSTISSATTSFTSTDTTPPPPPTPVRVPSPTPIPNAPRLAPTGLPFYSHTEPQTSARLPSVPTSNVQYFRYSSSSRNAPEEVNLAISRMISNLNSPPGSRWQGVVGFDMEWTVPAPKGKLKTGLIQISDDKSILLIQISSMKYFPSKLKALITSPTILKVGVNIGNDMRRLCREFGVDYAGRGIVDLSYLARAADVGLVGTSFIDLDSDRASIGIGILPKDKSQALASSSNGIIDVESDLEKEMNMSSEEITMEADEDGAVENNPQAATPVNKFVRPGRILIQMARLARRYLGRELEKGEERTSNWDIFLSQQQRRYAANDAHAGLALYHSLRSIHARSIAEGVIPVLAPPPWEIPTNSDVGSSKSSSNTPQTPGPPPFRAKTTTTAVVTKPEPQLVPVAQLQDLTPGQLDSLLPWSTLVYDLRADMDEARAAVQAKRVKEGVDINGKGEAVVESEAAAKAAAEASVPVAPNSEVSPVEGNKPTDSAHTSTPSSSGLTKDAVPAEQISAPSLADNYGTTPSKGMTRVLERQRAAEQKNEVMGKKWPPTRVTAPRLGQTSSSSSVASNTTSEPMPPPDSGASLPTKPTPLQLRAYLLWHNRKLPIPQICMMMKSEKAPLPKATVICYVIDALRLDPTLPFDTSKLKAMVNGESWAKEMYKEFLENKLGAL